MQDPLSELTQTQGKQVDYCHLSDPWEDKMNTAQTEAMLRGGEPKTLKEARQSPKRPKRKKVIHSKLCQFQNTGTWQLVSKEVDTIPIANKWVFTKKYRKTGKLLKYKGRLVAKGCMQ